MASSRTCRCCLSDTSTSPRGRKAQASDGALEEDEKYWIQQLAGDLPQLELPADATTDDEPRSKSRVEVVECTAADTARLTGLAQRCGVTSFMLRTAILQGFLARFTGQPDVLLGTPVAGRPRPELERLVGFFANTLALRTDLSGDPSFAGAAERVRKTSLDAYVHEAYPFDLLIERLNPVRDADRLPLVQTLFAVEPAIEARTVEGVTFEGLPDLAIDLAVAGGAMSRTGKLDLTVSCLEKSGGRLAWVFLLDGRRVSATAARRLSAAFRTFLAEVLERPDQRLSLLPVLPASERHRVVTEWNATDAPYPVACIHELIEAQARRTPDAVAVVCGPDRLTFAELDRRANWMAHRLRELGVGPDTLVGLYLERSLDLVIAMVATFKAGGGYLPLDPNYPRARLEWMLADAGASVVLTDRALRDRVPALPGVEVWPLDCVWRDTAASADAPPVTGVTPRHLAYVIYTSGSTGTAKGVDIEHASACAFLHAARQSFTREELAGSVASASICFDFSVFEILTPLAWGGTVILVENALHIASLSPSVTATMVSTVPSAMAELVRGGTLPASVRVVNLGGEALQNRLAQEMYEHARVERVLNVYGPTECTTYATMASIPRGATESPAIGRPIANTRVYVLDAHLEPVPIGAVGELFIGGAGLARGYHGQPALTAERFVPDPFSRHGGRLYRTGDRVRHRADGALEYLGRSDHQVKLRGYRIELAEIEAAILGHASVNEAVVHLREDAPGDKRLVVYVVRSQDSPPTASSHEDEDAAFARTLRRFVETKLPPYMVPSAIVTLEVLPRMPNDKVDRARLPAPVMWVDCERVLPRTGLERDIAAIWEDVLGAGAIGIDDNVFELGAHSLMATKVHRRIQELLVVQWMGAGASAPAPLAARIQRQVRDLVAEAFPLRAVFDYPTVRTLAASVSGGSDHPAGPSDPEAASPREPGRDRAERRADAIAPVPEAGHYPASHAQQRIWLAQRLDPTGSAYNIVFPLRLAGPLDASALEQALRRIVDRHGSLRTTIGVVDGALTQRIHPQIDLPWAVHDLSSLEEDERAARIRERLQHAAREPFDLETGPLVRAELLRAGDRDHRLLLGVHHVVMDGRSWEIVFEELVASYEAICSGAGHATPRPVLRYVDYAAWQNARLAEGRLEAAGAVLARPFCRRDPRAGAPGGSSHSTDAHVPEPRAPGGFRLLDG